MCLPKLQLIEWPTIVYMMKEVRIIRNQRKGVLRRHINTLARLLVGRQPWCTMRLSSAAFAKCQALWNKAGRIKHDRTCQTVVPKTRQ